MTATVCSCLREFLCQCVFLTSVIVGLNVLLCVCVMISADSLCIVGHLHVLSCPERAHACAHARVCVCLCVFAELHGRTGLGFRDLGGLQSLSFLPVPLPPSCPALGRNE